MVKKVFSTIMVGYVLASSVMGQSTVDDKFIIAVKQNKTLRAKKFIKRGADINYVDKESCNALLYSIAKSNHKLVNYLINHHAQFMPKTYIKLGQITLSNGLAIAAYKNDTAMANLLLKKISLDINERNYNPSTLNKSGNTPIYIAAQNNAIDMLKLLIQKKANINAINFKTGNTPLMEAVANKNIQAVNSLIRAGASVNTKNIFGQTALHIALANNSSAIAKRLILSGAEINSTDNQGFTPVMYAVANYNYAISSLLIEKGAKVNAVNKFGLRAIDYISKSENPEFYDFVYINTLSTTQLYLANYFETLENKITKGLIDINQKDKNGRTVLFYAVNEENLHFVKLFLSKGADPNILDNDMISPLDICLKKDNIVLKKILLAYGAKKDFNIYSPEIKQKYLLAKLKSDSLQRTALSYSNNPADSLLLKPSVLSKTDSLDRNIMHLAVLRNNTLLVKKLLQTGFSNFAKDKKGKTAADYAVELNNTLIIKYFHFYGIAMPSPTESKQKTKLDEFYLPDFSGIAKVETILNSDKYSLNQYLSKGIIPFNIDDKNTNEVIKRKLKAVGAYRQANFNRYISTVKTKNKELFYFTF